MANGPLDGIRRPLHPGVQLLTIEPERPNHACPNPAPPQRRAARLLARDLLVLAGLLCAGALSATPALATPSLTWTTHQEVDSHHPSSISCPSSALCVIVDDSGDELSSIDPTAPVPSWSTPASIDEGRALHSLSCTAPAVCAAVDGNGNVLATSNPSAGASSWRSVPTHSKGTLDAIACASSSLCVAVDSAGDAISLDPSNLALGTDQVEIDSSNPIEAISCPGASQCLAVDGAGNVLVSSDPGDAAPTWHRRAIDSGVAIGHIGCASSGLCVAFDSEGNALASNNPAAAAPTWSSTPIDATASVRDVSCSSFDLCVAVDSVGDALASDNAPAAPPVWTNTALQSFGSSIEGVACLPEGLCLAVDAAGQLLSALVPAPSLAGVSVSEVAMTSADLGGVVDPNDGALEECRFEYGVQTAFGQSIPCAELPSVNDTGQTVAAQLTGLSPGTEYRFRLIVSNGGGLSLGGEQAFKTVANPGIVQPHPYITGVPAVGLHLICHAGVSTPSPATLSYAWIRDATKISGAGGSGYTVKSSDAKHHLQCAVTATDASGSATASSAFVAVPAQGVIAATGETTVGRALAEGSRVALPVTCSPQSSGSCTLTLQLAIVESVRAGKIIAVAARRSAHPAPIHRRSATVGALTVKLTPGQKSTLSVPLNGIGSKLLARLHRLPVLLTVHGTVIGSIQASLSSQTVTLGASHASSRRAKRARR
jgi:hypothetical protein